MIRC
jgi:hypothetical protein